MRALFIAAMAVAVLAAASGCKGKGGGDEEVPLETIIEKEEIVGTENKPEKPDLEKVFAPPKCAEPDSEDPRGGKFPLEEALDGLSGEGNPVAIMKTTLGTITCELYADKVPNTVANFVGLARGLREWWNPKTCQWVKKPFYDGLIFHRVIPQFMIQGGCPLKNGEGMPGYAFEDEFHKELRHDKPGILSMANDGPATNGSQFFILDKWSEETGPPTRLDDKHSVFGLCTPDDVVFKIARVPQTGKPHNRPMEDIVIKSITIKRKEKYDGRGKRRIRRYQ